MSLYTLNDSIVNFIHTYLPFNSSIEISFCLQHFIIVINLYIYRFWENIYFLLLLCFIISIIFHKCIAYTSVDILTFARFGYNQETIKSLNTRWQKPSFKNLFF